VQKPPSLMRFNDFHEPSAASFRVRRFMFGMGHFCARSCKKVLGEVTVPIAVEVRWADSKATLSTTVRTITG